MDPHTLNCNATWAFLGFLQLSFKFCVAHCASLKYLKLNSCFLSSVSCRVYNTPNFDGRPLLDPLFSWLHGSEGVEISEMLSSVHTAHAVACAGNAASAGNAGGAVDGGAAGKLAEDEGDDVSRLPVTGMKEVGQAVGGEVGQSFGAVESVVDPPAAPPFRLQQLDRVKLLSIKHSGLNALLRRSPYQAVCSQTPRSCNNK